jgi:hypothetical protein
MREWLEPLAGWIVLAVTLLDVFLTVLYARAGSGLLAPRLARGVWFVLRALSGRRRTGILNFGGPVQLVALVLMWAALLALGAALVIHPGLGTGVQSSSGKTDTDFITALLVGGSSMSIVGASDYGPTSPGYKLLFLFNSLVGMTVTSLTITYVMQVYTAVRSRNTLALAMHAQSAETGDAAELIARWGARGHFDSGHSDLSTMAGDMAAIKEVFYAPPRFLLVALDAAALVRTALDERELGWLQESAALDELERTTTMLLRTLAESSPALARTPVDMTRSNEIWSARYALAVARMREAGIPTRTDQESGAREYVELRARWQAEIEALADALGWSREEVDRPAREPVGSRVPGRGRGSHAAA